jgi:hypothetical protein
MRGTDEIVECPCYRVCAALGVEVSRWCRYRESELPSPGTYRFDPKEKWCPAGVQANVLMLGYMLSGESGDAERLKPVLAQVRAWARELRAQPISYDPAKAAAS